MKTISSSKSKIFLVLSARILDKIGHCTKMKGKIVQIVVTRKR